MSDAATAQPTPRFAIGVDLGGSRIKLAAVDTRGAVLARSACETGDGAAPEAGAAPWAARVRAAIDALERRLGRRAAAIGLSAPGLAAADQRSIAFMPGRLEGLEGLDWTSFLDRGLIVPVINDAHAALLGEAWVGAARGLRHVVLLTLGTGVGGAVFADGRLLRGAIGRAGHLGHICLGPDRAADIVGVPGSLEDAIGNGSVRARSGGRFADTRDLVAAHRAGDAEASRVWLRSVYELACGLASLINVVDPEAAILAGGIAAGAGRALLDPLERDLARLEWRPNGHRVRIVAAALGEEAGALGAARLALERRPDATLETDEP